jgi:hypothetical protein
MVFSWLVFGWVAVIAVTANIPTTFYPFYIVFPHIKECHPPMERIKVLIFGQFRRKVDVSR